MKQRQPEVPHEPLNLLADWISREQLASELGITADKAGPVSTAKPIVDLPVFYADIINSDRYLPVSAINNTVRDAMLGRGLVTAKRLRMRGIR